MKSYKVFELSTNTETYFKRWSVMCDNFNWNHATMRNRKSKRGLPMIKGNNSKGGFYIITEIEVL